ncbi:3-oxoacyl-[acyl-carrier-protein] synthase II [Pectinatus haikarae]|uniref:3-oxoacyl-[acyl-carrier-protein] synthase 2 n=1 Tax=Pectinatus haikarae TaxID=349096 RepID=A0ABT9YC44_9FIRM|nr:3-oxoacyl-[acyl-carrier-protein] synthase II [Pectinatus haikarae]
MIKRRVVITGMGAITSQGVGVPEIWKKVKKGISGISRIEKFDIERFPSKNAAEIKVFNAQDFLSKKDINHMDLFIQYALAASKLAVEESKFTAASMDSRRAGSIIGTGIGGIGTIEKQYNILHNKGIGRVSPFLIPMMLPNMANGQIAIKYGLEGFSECVVTACASSNNAIGDAFQLIRDDKMDFMLAGGAEAPITELTIAGFTAMKAMSKTEDAVTASRPFDLFRDGFVIGEGAAILVLEELEHARGRGADIIAEIVGYGCNNDAFHITANKPEGIAECMRMALADAEISPNQIDYINAHATSTPLGDKNETEAIKKVFGRHAKKIAVSATKSMTGHLLGAAGGIETILTAKAIQEQYLPPTINYKAADPDCDLDYIPNRGRWQKCFAALTNSFGFGGQNAALVLRRIQK